MVFWMMRSAAGWLLGAAALTSVVTGCKPGEPSANARGLPPVSVQLQEIKLETVEDSSDFVGSLDAVQKAELKAGIQAQVETVLIAAGDRVRKGTVLMTLKPDQVLPQVDAAQKQLTSARINRENAAQQLKIADSQRATARSNYELAKINYDRANQLVSQAAIGQVTADQAKNQLDATTNALETANKQVTTARAVLSQAEAGVRQAEAQLISISSSFEFKQITSPIAGLVGTVPVKAGDTVAKTETVTTITPNRNLELSISIPTDSIAQLRQGLPVELLDPETKTRIAVSKLYFMPPRVDTGKPFIVARARFANLKGKLQLGQDAPARVIWSRTRGIVVPSAAIVRSEDKSFVFVTQTKGCRTHSPAIVEAGLRVCQRPVELGRNRGDVYLVKAGLKPGETIAISNISSLKHDTPVQVAP